MNFTGSKVLAEEDEQNHDLMIHIALNLCSLNTVSHGQQASIQRQEVSHDLQKKKLLNEQKHFLCTNEAKKPKHGTPSWHQPDGQNNLGKPKNQLEQIPEAEECYTA